jgi:hypothetical protein
MTVSIAKLANNTPSPLIIGGLSFSAGSDLVYWDAYDPFSTENTFNDLRVAEAEMYAAIDAGTVSMLEDGTPLAAPATRAAFNQVAILYDQRNNVASMLATGITLNEQKDSRGHLLMVGEKRVGSDLDVVTHNFADKTTWYTMSVRVNAEVPVDSGDGLTFNLAHTHLVDLNHGKMHNEDKVVSKHIAAGGHGYRPVVYIDDEMAVEDSPYSDLEGDYTIDYVAGTITFHENQSAAVLSVAYSYATSSRWTLRPGAGKAIDIEKSEAQFSLDVVYTDAIDFEVWGYNPADLPNKMIYETTSYKSMSNFIDEACGCYPTIPACGGPAPLGTTQSMLGFPFNYNTIRSLSSAYGVELVIQTRNDREFGGERATATFYCTIRDE